MSMAVTEGIGYHDGNKIGDNKLEFIDVRRAYFHARARRLVYVKLPEEDNQEGMCGRLNKAMYGTCDAAQTWECEYTEFMQGHGVSCGIMIKAFGQSFTEMISPYWAMRRH